MNAYKLGYKWWVRCLGTDDTMEKDRGNAEYVWDEVGEGEGWKEGR